MKIFNWKIIELKKRRYPICPECGEDTIVGFTPPKEPADFSKLGTDEYVDWDRASLYCCNGRKNCSFNSRYKDLTTPQKK